MSRKSPTINRQYTGWRGLLSLGLAVLLYPKKLSACARSPPHPSACAAKFPYCVPGQLDSQGLRFSEASSCTSHRHESKGWGTVLGHLMLVEPQKCNSFLFQSFFGSFPGPPSSFSTSVNLFLSSFYPLFSQFIRRDERSPVPASLFFLTFLSIR